MRAFHPSADPVLLPKDRLPEHLRGDYDMRHDMALDTTRIRQGIRCSSRSRNS